MEDHWLNWEMRFEAKAAMEVNGRRRQAVVPDLRISVKTQEQLFRDSTSLVPSNHSCSPQPKSPVISVDDYTKIDGFENLEIALFDVADIFF
jgi:hypothetical protein